MITDPYQNDKESIKELLKHYDNLRAGRSAMFLEEEAFEKIIDWFDDQEETAGRRNTTDPLRFLIDTFLDV